MTIVPRTEWVTSQWPFTGPRSDLDDVDEIIIHYPGVPAGALNLNDPVKVMRDTHSYYMRRHPTGYAFGYGWGVFPTGIYEGRGFDIRNAANAGHNDHTLSINVMVNGQDGATASQVRYVRELVELIWQRLGRRVPLRPHGDLSGAATQCPGRGIRAQIGEFYPLAQPEKPTDPQQPPQEGLMVTIYKIRGRYARFIALTTPGGVAVSVRWVSNQSTIAAHLAAGAREVEIDASDLENTYLDGPLPTGDVVAWTGAEFADT